METSHLHTIYNNSIITEDISKRIKLLSQKNNEKNIFVSKIKNLLDENENETSRENKTKVILRMMKVLDEYSYIWNPVIPIDNSMVNLSRTIKEKFSEFMNEKELSKESKLFLNKHFDEKCSAYTKHGFRCKYRYHVDVKGKFCKIHINFKSNIENILNTVLSKDISHKCLIYVFGF